MPENAFLEFAISRWEQVVDSPSIGRETCESTRPQTVMLSIAYRILPADSSEAMPAQGQLRLQSSKAGGRRELITRRNP